MGEARSGTVSVTRSGERDLRRGALSSSSLLSGGRNGMKGIGGGGGGVRRDIDRIFEGSGGGNGEFWRWRVAVVFKGLGVPMVMFGWVRRRCFVL